jgi:hypothetical protein
MTPEKAEAASVKKSNTAAPASQVKKKAAKRQVVKKSAPASCK